MAVALDVAVVLDPDGPRHADPAQVVAAEIDQHQMLGPLFLIGEQVLLQQLVFFLGVSAPARPRDRMCGGPAVVDRDQCLRTGADDRKRGSTNVIRDVQQVHVRAGVGHPQHAVDVDGVGLGVDLEALGRHHLECLAGLDLLDQALDHRPVLLERALRAVIRFRAGEGRHCRRQRLPQRLGHDVQSGHGVVIGFVDVIGRSVPVDRVGNQRDGALVVVDRSEVGGQKQQHVGQMQVVDGQFRQPFQPSDEVVGEESDQATRQRRHVRQRPGREQLDGGVQDLQGVAPGRCVLRRGSQPDRLAVAHGQRRRRTGADERPPRPGSAILGRLEQEGARTVGGQFSVGRQRSLAVGEHLTGHRYHPVFGGQRAELVARGRDGEAGVHGVHPPRPVH